MVKAQQWTGRLLCCSDQLSSPAALPRFPSALLHSALFCSVASQVEENDEEESGEYEEIITFERWSTRHTGASSDR